MDAAIDAVQDLVANASHGGDLDEVLQPFVRRVATALHDEDWDCEQDSKYFERFPQEMLGYDEEEYLAYLIELVEDSGGDPVHIERLAAHRRKMDQHV